MDISQWSLDKIMQLPDYCFGRRFPIMAVVHTGGIGIGWDISEIGFPEICVIWELHFSGRKPEGSTVLHRIALGDQLPTATAMMDGLEPLFPGFGAQGISPRVFLTKGEDILELRRLKMVVRTSGRRLVLEAENTGAAASESRVIVVVSSIPKDIPSWFSSG